MKPGLNIFWLFSDLFQDPVNVPKKIPKKTCIQIPKEICNKVNLYKIFFSKVFLMLHLDHKTCICILSKLGLLSILMIGGLRRNKARRVGALKDRERSLIKSTHLIFFENILSLRKRAENWKIGNYIGNCMKQNQCYIFVLNILYW